METNSTHPSITDAVCSGVVSLLRGTPLPPSPPSARRASHDHTLIGWGPLLFGFATSRWQIIQQQHLSSIRSDRSSRRWTIAWLRQLMQVAWDMWDHRNYILHNTQTPALLREHLALDTLIQTQFLLGTASLLPSDHFILLRQPLSHVTSSYSLASKRQWLELASLGRERYSLSLLLPTPSLQQQRLRAWLLPPP